MARYIYDDEALQIIDSYAKTVAKDGKVVVDAVRDIVAVITPTADVVPRADLEGEVVSFSLQKQGLWAHCHYKCGLTYWHLVEKDFGKTVFLTREEAEQALGKLQASYRQVTSK